MSEDSREPVFLRACQGKSVPYTPVWFMRQAGRYQPEYRAIREKVSFLELCKTPDLAAEVTVLAVEQLGVDAGIIFADILLPLEPMGLSISFPKDEGPQIEHPIHDAASIDALVGEIDVAKLSFTCDAIRKFRTALPRTPLIGFAGAPFTLASYAIEGGSSRHFTKTKALMYSDEGAFRALMEKLTEATARFLNAQIDAGAQVVQIFDSWVGALAPGDYRRYVSPHMKRMVAAIRPGIPVISFGTGTSGFLEEIGTSGAHVIGIDWRVEMGEARRRLPRRVLQGNLDPVALFAPLPELQRRVDEILAAMDGAPGHIFNLGHGILPGTPVETVKALVSMVHEGSAID